MKKNIFFLLCCTHFFLSSADDINSFTITGVLPDTIDNVYIRLDPLQGKSTFCDSAIVKKGRFLFTGIIDMQKDLYVIRSEQYPEITGFVVLEPGVISYNYHEDSEVKGIYAKGTELNDLLTDSIFIPSMKMAKIGEMLMNGAIDKANLEKMESINEMRSQAHAFRNSVASFVRRNTGNGAGEYVFLAYCMTFSEKFINEILPDLSEETRQKYLLMKGGIHEIKVGQQYIPFHGSTLDGESFNIADIIKKEKLILLDFWASWCVPCMKEMPVIAQLHTDYKDRGLEIIGISIDESESSWKKAVEKHKMSWLQIISKKGDGDDIAKLYGIYAIPHMILMDRKGTVIANNVRGQDLIMKIKEVLD